MSEERPVTGRRDNGLIAASWVAVAEVDPRQVADLFSTLAAVGIAAYAMPSPGLVGGYLEMRLPPRPVDRLHVDASRRTDAEAVLRAELDHGLLDHEAMGAESVDGTLLPPRAPVAGDVLAGSTLSADDDAAFAAIIAGWDTPTEHVVNPWPVSEDADPTAEDAAPAHPAAPGTPPRTPPRVVSSHPVERLVARVPDDDDHYVPPPPPPAPRIRLQTLLAILSIVVGGAVLIGVSIVGAGDNLPLVVGVLLIATGIVSLVAGMREDDGRDGWDDGAVV